VREDRELRYLTYISDAIRRVEERTNGGREVFLDDDVLQDAVIRRLETLADARGHDLLEQRGGRYRSPAGSQRVTVPSGFNSILYRIRTAN